VKRYAFVTAIAAVLVLSTLAQAADLVVKAPRPPAYDWSGFYIGGHVGYASAHKDWSDPVAGIDLVSFSSNGFMGGGQFGVNWQAGRWVLGAEGQASWTDLHKGIIAVLIGVAPPPIFFNPSNPSVVATRFGATIDQFGSVAGRLGYAFDRWLPYIKAGLAWVHDTYRVVHPSGANESLVASTTETRWGWMAGAGLEYWLSSNWSMKVEYNFFDFGRDRTGFARIDGGAPPTFVLDIDQNIQTVTLGINYRFNSIR
jgi:outer membrane immunogenic protein